MGQSRQVPSWFEFKVRWTATHNLPVLDLFVCDQQLEQPSDQQAIAAVISSVPGAFCKEVQAVGQGSDAGLWLLPALASTKTMVLDVWIAKHPQSSLAALPAVLSRGYLPQLQHVICDRFPTGAGQLAFLAQILVARPDLGISIYGGARPARIDELRAALSKVPAPHASSASGSMPATRKSAAAAAGEEEEEVTIDDEGRRLLLTRLMC